MNDPTGNHDVEGQPDGAPDRVHRLGAGMGGICLGQSPGGIETSNEVVAADGRRSPPVPRGAGGGRQRARCHRGDGDGGDDGQDATARPEPQPARQNRSHSELRAQAARAAWTCWAVTARSKASLRIRRSK